MMGDLKCQQPPVIGEEMGSVARNFCAMHFHPPGDLPPLIKEDLHSASMDKFFKARQTLFFGNRFNTSMFLHLPEEGACMLCKRIATPKQHHLVTSRLSPVLYPEACSPRSGTLHRNPQCSLSPSQPELMNLAPSSGGQMSSTTALFL